MTFEWYNALSSEDKVRFQWQVWETHLAAPSMGRSGLLWNRLYGHKRFMVNARPLREDDRWIFEREELPICEMFLPIRPIDHYPKLSPIMHLREKFYDVEEVITSGRINNMLYHWLDEPIEKGEKFKVSPDDYGAISVWGIPVKIEKENWEKGAYELPLRELTPIGIKT